MKFGGKTLSSTEKIQLCSNKIISHLKDSFPIVVVSAMGNSTQQLHNLLSKISTKQNVCSDFILSTGEMISAGMLSSSIINNGYKSQPLAGWQIPIVTNQNYGNASLQNISTKNLSILIKDNIIPIITGFQGITSDNKITTLGSGSSDLTAVALASKFKCNCYIYKDVDGVFTCDPKSNPGQKINQLSYDNMQHASNHGAQVIHNKAVEYAKKNNVNVFINSAFNSSKGTLISHKSSRHNIITKQKAYLAILKEGQKIQNTHAFISYDNYWCLFSSEEEYSAYLNDKKTNTSQEKYIKITLIHPIPINKEKFINIIQKYSQIYSCMKYYSWICVKESQSVLLEKELHDQFVEPLNFCN